MTLVLVTEMIRLQREAAEKADADGRRARRRIRADELRRLAEVRRELNLIKYERRLAKHGR